MTKNFSIRFIFFICMIVFAVIITFAFYENKFPLKYQEQILKYSNQYELQPELVASVINAESGFNYDRVSTQGAIGLMQIIPSTGKYIANLMGEENFSVEMLFDVETNINYGCYYLKYLFSKFDDETVCLSAYNAGEGVVRKWLKDQKYSLDGNTLKSVPYYETQNYVQKIEEGMRFYKNKF